NDFTSVYHHLINYLSKKFGGIMEAVKYRVYYLPDSKKELIDGAKSWFSVCSWLYRHDVIDTHDYQGLKSLVIGDKAYFQIGLAPGHNTCVELGKDRVAANVYTHVHSLDADVVCQLAKHYGFNYVRKGPCNVEISFNYSRENLETYFEYVQPYFTSLHVRQSVIKWLEILGPEEQTYVYNIWEESDGRLDVFECKMCVHMSEKWKKHKEEIEATGGPLLP
ncbi:hypothetical protein J7K27_05885, partial [Candidatus Bathyarchaeota archaeon]|nr:hypothetical protein [Candidatus Bathyarchaeota archaeon]